MKTKRIVFSALLAGKVADGSKTMTRRLVAWPEDESGGAGLFFRKMDGEKAVFEVGDSGIKHRKKAPYAIGDLLCVAEPWAVSLEYDKPNGSAHIADDAVVRYLADHDNGIRGRRRLARFMPARFARTFLKVTAIRCERLCEISDYDAIDEGIDCLDVPTGGGDFADYYRDYSQPFPEGNDGWPWIESEPVKSFESLWNHIYHKPTDVKFKDNPWVWVISFMRVEKPVQP